MKINWKKFILITIITFVIGSLFAFIIKDNMSIYKVLKKPINVPSILFPIVWSILYLLMSISFYIVTESKNKSKKHTIIYYAQLIVNSFWTLLFFGFNLYLFSFIWLLILMILVIIMIYEFYNLNKKAGLLQIPYLLWVIFAGYLNLGIFLLNK